MTDQDTERALPVSEHKTYGPRWCVLEKNDNGRWMLTLGSYHTKAIRITRGRIDKRGKFHPLQPCVFRMFLGRRIER